MPTKAKPVVEVSRELQADGTIIIRLSNGSLITIPPRK